MNDETEDQAERDREDRMLLLGTLRTVSAIGAGVVLITCLFLGAAWYLDDRLHLGRGGIAAATVAGVLLGLYWAFRRVEGTLRRLFPGAAPRKPPAPSGGEPPADAERH